MGDGLEEDRLHVFRRDVIAPLEPGDDARCAQQHAHATRARAGEHQPRSVEAFDAHAVFRRHGRGAPQAERIGLQRSRGLHGALDQVGHGVQFVVSHHRCSERADEPVGVVKARVEHERAAVIVGGRRVDRDLEHEAVARGRGDLERLFALDPVAVGEHQQVREAELAVEGRDAAFGHHPQQQRMHLRAGAVDLVEEEYRKLFAVLDQRPALDRRAPFSADVRVVDQVARHQVDRAFDAREVAAEHAREGTQQGRLADAHVALQQHVPACENSRVDAPDHTRLADHAAADLRFERERALAPVSQTRIISIHAGTPCRERLKANPTRDRRIDSPRTPARLPVYRTARALQCMVVPATAR